MFNPAERLTDTWLTHMLSRPGSGAVTDSQNRARAPHVSKPHTREILPFLSFEAPGRGPAFTKGFFFFQKTPSFGTDSNLQCCSQTSVWVQNRNGNH